MTCGASSLVFTQQTIRPYLWQAGMARSEVGEINVFRRFPAERRAQVEDFYARVLALPALPSTAPGGGQMIRYPVGASEVKLFPTEMAAPNVAAAGDVAGHATADVLLCRRSGADETVRRRGASCRPGSSRRPHTAARHAPPSCRTPPGTGSSS